MALIDQFKGVANAARAIWAGNKPGGITTQSFPVQIRRIRQDVANWRRALDQAEAVFYPQRTLLLNIYADVVLDAHLASVLQTRKINVLGKPFKLVDSAGKENPKLTKLLMRPWFRQACDAAMDSKFYGHSLIEFDTPVDGQFHKVSLIDRQYVFPEAGIVRTMPGMVTGTDYRNDPQFAPWILEIGGPRELGLLCKAAPYVIWKKNVLSAWADFVEMFGMPYRSVTGDMDAAQIAAAEKMMAEMGQAGYGIFSGDQLKVDFIAPSTGNDKIYDSFVARVNSELSKLVLGQTMTTDDGSSQSQANVHERVADAYTRDDSTWLSEWLNEELLPFLLMHGYPLAGYEFRFDDTETLSKEQQFTIVQGIMKDSGYQVAKSYLEETFGVVLEDKPAPVAPPALPGKPQGLPAFPVRQARPDQQPQPPGIADITAAHDGPLDALADRLIMALHEGRGPQPGGALYTPLQQAIAEHLDGAVTLGWHAPDPALRGLLQQNVTRFSGFKTYAVQQAMREKLIDAAGNIRPFAAFRTEALAVHAQYNVRYLETEYNQAIAAGQMASKWAEFSEGAMLRYETAGDDHVRAEHEVYNNITRPKDDPFWDTTYPPCDWGCRCTVTEVDGDAAVTPAHELQGLPDVPEEFRQNVGKTGEVYGPDHPYFDVEGAVARRIEAQLPEAPEEPQLPGDPRAAAVQLLTQVVGANPLPAELRYLTAPSLRENALGEFRAATASQPPRILHVVTGRTQVDVTTVLHEQGHALDNHLRQQLLHEPAARVFASQQTNSRVSGVMKAIQASPARQRLDELLRKAAMRNLGHKLPAERFAHLRYLQRPEESFARAFSQYIAVRSGQTELTTDLILHQRRYKDIPEHWNPADFTAIAAAFDHFFSLR